MESHPVHLFAYGTLQYAHVWRQVVKGEYEKEYAFLEDFQACVIKGVAYPGLKTKEGAFAKGLIYFDISDQDLKSLDVFEGDNYKRVEVFPEIVGQGKIRCHTYLFVGPGSMLRDEVWDFDKYLQEGHGKFISGYSGWNKI